jgi:RNA polymerase sigma-70 factor (ECF subfamily)
MEFRAVYEEHFRFVWRTLRGLGVREADATDAAQEVFVVVHRRLAEFEARSKFTTWLFGICQRVARDRWRAARSRPELTHWPEDHDPPDPDADIAYHAERREAVLMLEAILDEIPEEQRIVFVLFELEELPGEQISEMLGIPVPTVHSRLRLARERFRQVVSRAQARARSPSLPCAYAGPSPWKPANG